MNSHAPLFRHPSVTDKLNLFKMLFDSSEINTDIALALLKVIHRDLGNEHTRDRSAYKRYAETIESLRYHKADMLKQIVDAWNGDRAIKEPEWITSGVIK